MPADLFYHVWGEAKSAPDGVNAPGCTVTVFLAGTQTKATLYADGQGAQPLANPFLADSHTYFSFSVAPVAIDVQFSGLGVPIPYTLGDYFGIDPRVVVLATATPPVFPFIDVTVPRVGIGNGTGVLTGNSASANRINLNALLANTTFCPVTGVVLWFPPGTYLLDANVTITNQNTWLMGGGEGQTILKWTGDGGLLYTIDVPDRRIHITDLTLTTTTTGTSTGILISGSAIADGVQSSGREVIIENIAVKASGNYGGGYFATGLWLRNVVDVLVFNSKFSGVDLGGGVFAANTYGIKTDKRSLYIYVENCSFVALDYAMRCSQFSEGIEFIYNNIQGANYGFYYAEATTNDLVTPSISDGVNVIGCGFTCSKSCVFMDKTAQGVFNDNVCFNYVGNFPWSAIFLASGSLYNHVCNNFWVKAFATTNFVYGAIIEGSYNVVNGNIGQQLDPLGISIWFKSTFSGAKNIAVGNNQFGCSTAIFDEGAGDILSANQPT